MFNIKMKELFNKVIEKSVVEIKISNSLKNRLSQINDKVSKFILGNLNVCASNIKKNYPNYLDFDGNLVTYINSNKETKFKNLWGSNTRQSTKAVRILRKIYKNEFIDKKLTQRDIEIFVSNWNASLDNISKVVVYKGWDILKAFNFNGMIDLKNFQTSCANFKQDEARKLGKSSWTEPMIKWFYFYIYNENISTAVVIENGIIKARSVIFEGQQIEDHGDWKMGETYTILNNIYSEGQEKYKSLLLDWAKERGYYYKISSIRDLKNDKLMNGAFKLKGFKFHYKTYCPVDSLYVNLYNYTGNNTSAEKGEYHLTNCQYNNDYVSLYKFSQKGGEFTRKNREIN